MRELNDIQYEMLIIMDYEWCYPYKHFDKMEISREFLKKEMKALREAGLVEFHRGLMDEEGMVAGSGHSLSYKNRIEIKNLIRNYEFKFSEMEGQMPISYQVVGNGEVKVRLKDLLKLIKINKSSNN